MFDLPTLSFLITFLSSSLFVVYTMVSYFIILLNFKKITQIMHRKVRQKDKANILFQMKTKTHKYYYNNNQYPVFCTVMIIYSPSSIFKIQEQNTLSFTSTWHFQSPFTFILLFLHVQYCSLSIY